MHFLRCPLAAPDGPCVLTRPLGEDGINNNNSLNNKKPFLAPPAMADGACELALWVGCGVGGIDNKKQQQQQWELTGTVAASNQHVQV